MSEIVPPTDYSHLPWMPSRVPLLDALTATFPNGVEPPEDRIPKTAEQRWFPLPDGGVRLMLPYSDGPYDNTLFSLEPKAWDHTHCDACNMTIPAMTLHYVTRRDAYIELCASCYETHVARKVGFSRYWIWRLKRILGRPSEA